MSVVLLRGCVDVWLNVSMHVSASAVCGYVHECANVSVESPIRTNRMVKGMSTRAHC